MTDSLRNDFIRLLFGTANEELESALNDDSTSSHLRKLFRDYSWDIVDTAFLRGNDSQVGESPVDVNVLLFLLKTLKPYVRAKEWEIIVLEKVYTCQTAVEFQLLLYSFQLLIVEGTQSFVDLCRGTK